MGFIAQGRSVAAGKLNLNVLRSMMDGMEWVQSGASQTMGYMAWC